MPINRKNTVITALVFSCSTPAFAENLVEYARDSSGSVFFYDRDNIRKNSSFISVWTWIDRSRDKTVAARSERQKIKIDCSNEKIGIFSFVEYNSDGNVIKSSSTDYPKMDPVVPESIGGSLMIYLC